MTSVFRKRLAIVLACVLLLAVTPAVFAEGPAPSQAGESSAGQVPAALTPEAVLGPAAVINVDGSCIDTDGNGLCDDLVTYKTIQAAIAAAAPNDTISVAAGAYTEIGQIVIAKNLTITGVDRATTIIKPAADTGGSGDARGWFLVNAGVTFNMSAVTLDGLGKYVHSAIRTHGDGTLNDIAFQNIAFSPGSYDGRAVSTVGDVSQGITVSNSTFSSIGRIGVLVYGATTAVISGNTYTGKGTGDWLDYAFEAGGGGTMTVTGNTITGCTGVAATDGSTSAGMLVTTYWGGGTTAAIENNFITGNTDAVAAGYDASDTSVVTVHNNDLSGNLTYAVGSTAPSVDASGNWWGSAVPAAVKSAANSGMLVDFTPWLASGADTVPGTAGFQGDFSTLWVDDDSPQTGATGRIQEGINLVSGSTVNVAAGTYPEALHINKDLTLAGAGRDVTVIQAPTVLPIYAWNSGYNSMVAIDTATVDISGFKIDGLHKGDGGSTFVGVHFWQSSGSITDSKITAFRDSTLGGNQDGFGIVVNHGWDVHYSQVVNIDNNIIDDYQKGGIVVTELDSNATINNNTVTGQGPTTEGQVAQNGIQIGYGAGGSITNNTVAAHDYTPTSWSASGIGLTGTDGVAITSNNVSGNEVGISLSEDEDYSYGGANNSYVTLNDVTGNQTGIQVEGGTLGNTGNVISNNTIAGNTVIGVDNTSINSVDAINNWWGSACGPGPVGPGSGDEVSTNVVYSPWWTALGGPGTASEGSGGELVIPSTATTADENAILACAAGKTVMFATSGSPYPGGMIVNGNGTTVNLNGATIGPGSPAFTINADDVTILGPGALDGWTGSANSASPGILVSTGADNFILQDVEVKRWANGVEVAGNVVSLKIVDNFIHDNTGAGLQVNTGVTIDGVTNVYGNLFKVNGGNGIQNDGATSLPALYNSWGDIDGSAAGTGGDGVSANVDASQPTFLEYFMDMDPDTLASSRRVGAGASFDVMLKADSRKVNGIAFKLNYEAAVLHLNSATYQGVWAGASCLTPTPVLGVVEGACFLTAGEWDGDAAPILKLNFTVLTLPSSPYPSALDILHNDADTNAGAYGGAKVYVNNAGYGLPSTPALDITDPNDGELILGNLANYTGFVDLQGRANESGATLLTKDVADKLTSMTYASGTSVSGGAYTTAHLTPRVMFQGETFWFQFDRALYLPTTQMAISYLDDSIPTTWQHSKLLLSPPTTSLASLILLGGDGTDDDEIDILDAGCMGSSYRSASVCAGGPGANSDVNGDGITDILDLSLMGGNYYKVESPWTP